MRQYNKEILEQNIEPINAWREANVFFRQGQHLSRDDQKIEVSGKVRFDGAWLHIEINENNEERTVSVAADSVDRVEWK